jgi:DNA-directed RNA polymerase subunit M/transcription elongation factor TFIIS
MGINLTCPQCGERMTYDLQQALVRCKHCGYSPLEADQSLERKQAEMQARGPRKHVMRYHRGQVHHLASSAFETGHDFLHQGNREEAFKAFRRAADLQSDFTDAYLWMAQLTDDPKTKRDYLETVLAYDPGNLEGTRLLMVLDGRMTPEQAARTYHDNDPELRAADAPVKTETTALLCPVCHGQLTVDEANGRVTCRFCGYDGTMQSKSELVVPDNIELLSVALLERKAQSVKWVIGERLLHCNQCGAERTIPARKLSEICPFCGSNHVIVKDALDSFEQPDALIPFKVTAEEAAEHIKESLKGISERFKGFFDSNKVARAKLDGVYLPFWAFDALVEVTKTTIDNRMAEYGGQPRNPYTSVTTTDAQNDVLICGVISPPPDLTAKLGNYDLDTLVPYQPKLLAKHPAELYSIDFDKASLDVRSIVGRNMRERHHTRTTSSEVQVNIFSSIRQMSFRLLLLPVWVATLTEVDGDLRTALVNGQTGQVALGKTEKQSS